MAEPKIIFKQQWETEPTDLSNCSACGDIIFSDMHIPVFVSGDIVACVDVVLCESCYNVLSEDDKIK